MAYPKYVTVSLESLDKHKAEDIQITNTKKLTPFTDYVIVATAPNETALGSIADYLVNDLEEQGLDIKQVDGNPRSEWIIVDEGFVIVHIFTEEKRNEINIEELYKKRLNKLK